MEKILTQKDYLKTAKYRESIWDFCGNYYKLYINGIDDEQIGLENLILLLEWNGVSDESYDVRALYSKSDCDSAMKEIAPVVSRIVDNLVSENPEEDTFYKAIFDKINDTTLLTSEIEITCALVQLVLNPKIPYYKLGDALKMDDKKYKEITSSITTEISKAIFILHYGYSQKTELASQLYYLTKGFEDEEKRIVLIANILSYQNTQMRILYDMAKKNNNDEQ